MATKPALDDRTALTLRRALAAAHAGRIAEACAIGEEGLAHGGDVAALNAMLGMLRAKGGDAERAIVHLRAAHAARPDDPIVALNLAQMLVTLERHREVLAVLTDRLVEADTSGRLRRIRAFSAQSAEEFELAVADYERLVGNEPNDWESWNNLGNARRNAGDMAGAVAALERAAALAPDSAPVRFNHATCLLASGAVADAEAAFRQMAADFPNDPAPLRELHVILKESSRDTEAEEAIVAAVGRAPRDVELRLGHASFLIHLQRLEEAETAYRRVLDLDPTNGLAHLGIAACLDLTNRTAELTDLVRAADDGGTVPPDALNFMKAIDHRRAKRFAEGLAALEAVPADLEPARRAHVLGQLLEGVGRYDDAFAEFTTMNALAREQNPVAEQRGAAYRDMIRARRQTMTGEFASQWRPSPPSDRPSPVFLYGFPRSGTTLLDTMLMGHPRIEVLEEEPILQHAFQQFETFEAMASASDAQIEAARQTYFDLAAERTPLEPGSLLIDKNPLSITAVPTIKRLFPDAKHILALRHPCDVILSCFVTNFRMNDGMASFSRLDTAAELYDLSFGFFEEVRAHLDVDVHAIRYEDVVADRDAALRDLFGFLSMDWHDAVLDHEATARGRGRIKTASYAQVVEPIYTRSAGRWTNYRAHLEPVLPVLRPWIEKFGYAL